MKYLDKLKAFQLSTDQFAIFGSGPMGIRGIREAADIDIVVKESTWDDLFLRYPDSKRQKPTCECLSIGNIEIYKTWPKAPATIDEMIDTADTIQDLPFVKLEYVLAWKKAFDRDKDKKDVTLINEYLKNQT